MPDGMLTVAVGQEAWVWCGVEVQSCTDLTKTKQFRDMSEGDRYQKALTADDRYLAQFLGPQHSIAVDLRWLRDPGSVNLRLAVLGRILARSPHEARAAGDALLEKLANLPPHVNGAAITDDGVLAAFLQPFTPSPYGMVGITKRCVTARPERQDVNWRRHFAVQPLNVSAQSWEEVLRAVYRRSAPTAISVALEPMRLSDPEMDALGSYATTYGRLAQPGRIDASGLAGRVVDVAPDQFAVFASPIYGEACRRYRDNTFRLRIALASSEPIEPGLAELLSVTISPPMDAGAAGGGGYAVSRATRSSAQADRPEDAQMQATFVENLAKAGTDPWGPSTSIRAQLDAPAPWLLDRFMRVVDVEEACAAFRFPVAVAGHMPGFPVVTPGAAHRSVTGEGPTFRLGARLDGGIEGQEVLLDRDQLTRHALVCGAAGTGKTNTTLNLCHQIWSTHRVPFLVIDPVKQRTDYRMLIDLPGMGDVVVLTGGNDRVAPFRINPFVVSVGVSPSEHCGSLLTAFRAAFGLWDPLPGIYAEALADVYRDSGFVLDEPIDAEVGAGWPTLEQFIDALTDVVEARGYAGEQRQTITAASVGRAKSLSTGVAARILDCDISYPVEELLARPTVLELAGLSTEPEAQSLVVGLVLSAMTTYFKQNWRETRGLKHVTVIEEAHRLLARPEGGGDQASARKQAAELFANSLAENRGYGEGIVVVEQVPTKLIQDAIKNSNLKVLHLLPGRDDQIEMAGAMGLTEDQVDFIPVLGQGEAFVGHDGIDRAMHVKAPLLEKPAQQPSDEQVRSRFDLIGGPDHEVAVALRPFVDCVECTSPCQFRSRARSVVSRTSVPTLKRIVQGFPSEKNRRYQGPPVTPTVRRAWRDDLLDHVRELQPLAAGTSAQEQVDELTCRFIHLMRGAFRRGRDGHLRSFRAHALRALAASTEHSPDS